MAASQLVKAIVMICLGLAAAIIGWLWLKWKFGGDGQ